MTKLIRILAVLAVIQAILAIVLLAGGSGLQGPAPGKTLLAFSPDSVDKITLLGKDKARVVLQRRDGHWQTEDGFPADKYKVDRLLKKLAGLKAGLPVSTSESALTRFQLDDDGYQRKILLDSGGKTIASLTLGSGAGARKTHARAGDSHQVFSIALGTWDTPVKVDDWRDKTVLQIKKDSIEKLTADGFEVQRQKAEEKDDLTLWTASDLPEGKIINQKAINELVTRLGTLRFDKRLGNEAKPEYGLDKPALAFTVTADSKALTYRFGKHKDNSDYILKRSDRDDYFSIPGYTVDSLKQKVGKSAWLMDKPKAEKTSSEDKASSEPDANPPAAKPADPESSSPPTKADQP